MFDEFINYNKEYGLFNPGDRVLLAVSGGIDSMVMSHLLLRVGTAKGIAHCNFCLRDKESDMDEEFVRKYAGENNIPFYSIRFKTKEYAHNKGISIQMAARDLRYDWFEKIRLENNFDLVAIAHNLNDNAETLLLNLIRGTGITGLSGIKPVGNKIIRPILFASRNKIEDYCILHNISFREDKSNTDIRYTRNKIRNIVLPVLKEINPSIEKTLCDTAEKLAGADEIITGYVNMLREQLSRQSGESVIFDIEKLLSLSKGKALIFELFSPYGISGTTTRDLISVLQGGTGKQILTKTNRLVRNRNELIINPLSAKQHGFYKIRSTDDLLLVPGIRTAGVLKLKDGFKIPVKPNIACIDFEKLKFPMVIRTWRRGDYFFPFGMNQKKKLSDFFIDRKYSLTKKEGTLLLESEGNIVWIINERLDNRYRISESTKLILRIEAENS